MLKLFLSQDFFFELERKLKKQDPKSKISIYTQYPKSSFEVKDWAAVNKSFSHDEQTTGRMRRMWETQRGPETEAEAKHAETDTKPPVKQQIPKSILEENVEGILSSSNVNSVTQVTESHGRCVECD